MNTGRELVADIDACELGRGELAFWWLGQHGFALKLGATVAYVDPFLAPGGRRRVPPLLEPEEVTNADFVFGSHDHGDHIDRGAWPGVAQASPGASFVVPKALLPALARELGIPEERFVGLDHDEGVEVAGLKVTGVAAAHEFLDRDPATGAHPYLGFVVEGDGCAIYHAGDTCIWEGQRPFLERWQLDAAFLPINGRDARRLAAGCIGNMTYQEAADLAGTLAPRLTVPAHYEMFASNSEDPQLFVDYMRVKYPALEVGVPEHGERVVLGPCR
ncbi:MAG: MBL fold metallo-hydrolase [Planctomycetota bacterium]|jgi:L-ascorbate metabolism protein UlaG (beta-lactamase superfamily)